MVVTEGQQLEIQIEKLDGEKWVEESYSRAHVSAVTAEEITIQLRDGRVINIARY